jgi:hypothetical protein
MEKGKHSTFKNDFLNIFGFSEVLAFSDPNRIQIIKIILTLAA